MRQFGRAMLLSVTSLMAAASTQAQSVQTTQAAILTAICRSDWDQAMDLTGSLMASSRITPESRSDLVAFREQLIQLRDNQVQVTDWAGCNTVLARFIPAESVPEVAPPLDWESAIATLAGTSYFLPPDQLDRQIEGNAEAGLARQIESENVSLSPAIPIDTRTGMGVSAGQVSQDYQIFTFIGGLGDRINIDVDVTQVQRGMLYSDDDSQLFLFDSQGRLLSDNDDQVRLQSRISGFVLPESGPYYVAVTTYNNDPILDADRRVIGWSGNGGSSIQFTVTISGVTPTEQLVLPEGS